MPIRWASGINFQSRTRDMIASQPGNSAAMSAEFRQQETPLALSLVGER